MENTTAEARANTISGDAFALVEHLRTAVPKMRTKRSHVAAEVSAVVLPVERVYLGSEPTDQIGYAGPNPYFLVGDTVIDAWLSDFDNDQLNLDFKRLLPTLPVDLLDALRTYDEALLTVDLTAATVTLGAPAAVLALLNG